MYPPHEHQLRILGMAHLISPLSRVISWGALLLLTGACRGQAPISCGIDVFQLYAPNPNLRSRQV